MEERNEGESPEQGLTTAIALPIAMNAASVTIDQTKIG